MVRSKKRSSETTLRDFQKLIDGIYTVNNDRQYTSYELVIQLQRFVMRMVKGVRKNDQEKIERNLAIACAWTMAIGNRFHFDLQNELIVRFPGVCPYCLTAPCSCKAKRRKHRQHVPEAKSFRNSTLDKLQSMLARIYPNNTLADIATHAAEEVAEVAEAAYKYAGTHNPKCFEEIRLELVDVIANLLGVATCAGLRMIDIIRHLYFHGCHECRLKPCRCTFFATAQFN